MTQQEAKGPRRVIDGSVTANASEATATNAPTNAPTTFYYREQTHFRVVPHTENGEIVFTTVTMIERVHEGGAWPAGFARFQGIAKIEAPNTPIGPISQNYKFDVPGETLMEAWERFEVASEAGAQAASQQVRQQIAAVMQRARQTVVPASPADVSALLGPDGRPVR